MAQASTEKKISNAKSTAKQEANKVAETVKDTALASLGVVGKLFDRTQDRVDGVRTEVPKKWDEFVNRGEQLKDTANDKVNDINVSFKYNVKEQRAQFNDLVDALIAFVKPSKA